MGYEELLNALMNLSVRDAVDTGKKGVRGAAEIGKAVRTGTKLAGKAAAAPLAVPMAAGRYVAGEREPSERVQQQTRGMRAGQQIGARAATDPYGTGKAMYDAVTGLNVPGRPAIKNLVDAGIDQIQGQRGGAPQPPIEMNPYLKSLDITPMPGSTGQQGDYNKDLKYRGTPQIPQIAGRSSGSSGGGAPPEMIGVQGIRDINQMSPEEEELMRAIIAQRMTAAQGANLVGQPATAPRYTG